MIKRFVHIALWVFIAFTILNDTPWVGRQIGKVFPVVTPITVTSTVAVTPLNGPEETIISGWAVKNCGRCTFQGIYFYVGKLGGVPVAASFDDPPKVRSSGLHEWKALRVAVPEKGMWLLQAEVLHRWGVINIRSPFFP